MNPITSVSNVSTTLPIAENSQESAPTVQADIEEAVSTTRVTISDLGQILSVKNAQGADKTRNNEDIDNSNLPATIKNLLKRIRELQVQIREQQQKQNEIMVDSKLSPEQKRQQLLQVQSMISSLSGALSSAMGEMDKAMQNQSLTKDQQITAVSLLA